jgi:hypothetical protein
LGSADDLCQVLADGAKLPGTYMAWLSDGTTSAASRLWHGSGPYVLVDGTVVATDWTGLTSGTLLHGINLDEHGATVPSGTYAWTGTLANGTTASAEDTCRGWTFATAVNPDRGLTGAANGSGSWSQAYGVTCDNYNRLYCIQQ